MIVKITTFLLFSYCVQSTGHNSNDIGVSKILQCYAMLAQFEDLDYCVQLTGHNKQKTGHNSGGILIMGLPGKLASPASQLKLFTKFLRFRPYVNSRMIMITPGT